MPLSIPPRRGGGSWIDIPTYGPSQPSQPSTGMPGPKAPPAPADPRPGYQSPGDPVPGYTPGTKR